MYFYVSCDILIRNPRWQLEDRFSLGLHKVCFLDRFKILKYEIYIFAALGITCNYTLNKYQFSKSFITLEIPESLKYQQKLVIFHYS